MVRVLVLLVASSALISGSIDAGAAAVSQEAPSAPTPPKGIAVAPNTLIALQQARATGQPVIVADHTTKSTLVYANPDQTFTSTIADGPVQEPNSSSPTGFTPVNLSLMQLTDGSWAPRVSDAHMAFANGGTAAPVTMSVGQRQLVMKWPSTLPVPTISGSTATYKDVAPGVNLELQALTTGFDLRVVLTQRPASTSSFRIPLALTGLTPTLSAAGRLQFQDAGKTQVVADRPVMYDASVDDAGNPLHTTAVSTTLDSTGSMALVVSPQDAFLSDPSTKYPVTIDPAPNLSATIDTFVNSASPTQTYGGSTLIKAGKSSAEGPDRSLLQFDTTFMEGANVTAASLNLYESFSNSCTATGLEVWDLSASWTQSVNWNTQPAKNAKWASSSTSAGGGTGCPAAYVGLSTGGAGTNTLAGLVQAWARGTATNNGLMVVASNETSTSYFKRFSSNEAGSNAPFLAVTYNFPPGVSGGRLPNDGAYVPTTRPTLQGTLFDQDAGTVGEIQYELDTSGGTVIDTQLGSTVPSGSTSSWQIPAADALTNGTTYKWRARGYDGTDYGLWLGYRTFTVDTTAPSAPTISSSTHPNPAQWYSGMSFTGSWPAVTDTTSGVAGYAVKVDQNPGTVPGGALQTALTYSKTVAYTGIYYIHVRAQDNAGNWGTTTTFEFNVGSGGLVTPAPGDRTQQYVTVQAAAGSGITGATLQYRRSPFDNWTTIPAADVVDSDNGNASITWPVTISGGTTHHLRWDAKSTLSSIDGPVMVRSTFSPGSPSPSTGITISLDQNFFDGSSSQGNAFAQVGPGQVNLTTGDFTLSGSDANVGDFSVDRTFDSTMPTAQSGGVFGPGWSSSLNLGTYQKLHAVAGPSQMSFAVIYGADDTEYGFQENQSGTGFIETPDAIGMTLTYSSGSSSFVLTDQSGVQTTFTQPSGSTDYYPATVVTPNNGSQGPATTTMQFAATGGVTRPTAEYAPTPTGITPDCTQTFVRGCQELIFNYASSSTGSNDCSSAYGDYTNHLKTVSYKAWDPSLNSGNGAINTVIVAEYSYDSTGWLRATCDPRISPVLATTYSYDGSYRVSSITPAGLNGWTLNYDSSNHITSASRANDPSGTQTTSVVYNVPISGSGAPYNLSAATTATWAQQDDPTQATAIFPADEVPGNPPADYNYATVYYMDSNGNEVNVAEPGGNISTSEYDQNGSLVRELNAQNRADALASGDSVSYALTHDAENTYDSTGGELLRQLGPDHQIVLSTGAIATARQDIQNTYDQNHPTFVTGRTEGALLDNATTDVDVRTQSYDYSGQSGLGFSLFEPTSTTIDPGTGKLNLTTTKRYNSLGEVVATIMPANPAGGDAHETDTTYYQAGTGSGVAACDNHAEWANLVCQTAVAAQPGTSGYPDVPTKLVTYDMWGNVVSESDTAGTNVRTSTSNYEAAAGSACPGSTCTDGRLASETVTGPGTSLPTVNYSYDSTNGLPHTISTTVSGVTTSTTSAYDSDGRLSSYTDADGNISTYTYDTSDRPVSVSDGKGTETLGYNQGTERRGLLTGISDSRLGALSATFDANGTLATETFPNGMTATNTTDAAGDPISRTFVKTTNCASACTWFSDQVYPSANGQISSQATPMSEQAYTYDGAGRLSWTDDTIGGQCTTKHYAYDLDSNRAGLTTRPPNSDGSCNTTATGSTQSWTYDGADRATSSGYGFDSMGRITGVPAVDAGGAPLTVSYYANDAVNTLTESGVTDTVTLDPEGRQRQWSNSSSTTTNHYSSQSDEPAWISENASGSSWTRYVPCWNGLCGYSDQSGAGFLGVTTLSGNVEALASTSGTATALTSTFETDEFGAARAGQPAPRYGWLGGLQRARDLNSGVLMLGARAYLPQTGRFLQTDPLPGGSANGYDYANQDPVNEDDPSGDSAGTIANGSLVGCKITVKAPWQGSAYFHSSASWWCPKSTLGILRATSGIIVGTGGLCIDYGLSSKCNPNTVDWGYVVSSGFANGSAVDRKIRIRCDRGYWNVTAENSNSIIVTHPNLTERGSPSVSSTRTGVFCP
jgi:RHS repeat-associated protein